MKRLKKVNAGSPLMTNASCNRAAAEKAFKAGVSITDIVAFWPEIWKLTKENGRDVISQRYDYELNDGSGRYETNRRITNDSVQECIAKHGKLG